MAVNNSIEWSTEEMIANANHWSLAGDVALLNSLRKFSKNLITNTETLSAKVDNLVNNLETVGLKLELTKNEFHSLRNTQFIENRVYEDDETIVSEEQKEEHRESTEEDKENVIKNAILSGLKVLEKYYDKVELDVSDSDGEGFSKTYVLKSKDIYADRPLPYIVGTEDWFKKWHVGLEPSDSESESEKEVEEYSSSDSEKYIPKNVVLGSETSSEVDFTRRNKGPVANSTFNDSEERGREIFQSSDESSDPSSSAPVKTPISNSLFAEQLAEKLGDVLTGKVDTPNTVTKIKPEYGSLFSDQPPPMEDLEKTVLPKSGYKSLFSGDDDLFSENTGDDLFGDFRKETSQGPKKSAIDMSSRKQASGGLFDYSSDSSSEEDLLAIAEKKRRLGSKVNNSYVPAPKSNLPFLDEEPPELLPNVDSVKKKPVGGKSVFGDNPSLFAEHITTKSTLKTTQKAPKVTNEPSVKKGGFFDDLSENEEDDIFIPKRKIVDQRINEDPQNVSRKIASLFDDSDDELNISKNRKEDSNSPTDVLFEEKDKTADKDIKRGVLPKKESKKISLFDDDDDFSKEEEDIFASIPKKNSLFDYLEEERNSKVAKKGLFEDLEPASSDNEASRSTGSNKTPVSLFQKIEENGKKNLESVTKKPIESLFDDLSSPDNTDSEIFSHASESESTKSEGLIVKVDSTIDTRKSVDNESTNNIKQKQISPILNKEDEIKSNQEVSLVDVRQSSSSVEHEPKPIIDDKQEMLAKMKKVAGLVDVDSDNSSHDEFVAPGDRQVPNQQVPLIANDDDGSKSAQGEIEDTSVTPPSIEVVPPINLFDPNPPPVDWEASSDNSGDSDNSSLTDGILNRSSYDQSQPSSSIFDEAPPRLDVNDINYSSGIGRDINVTRVESSVDSTFYPYASSSRRLSSDIFSDEQSQDSFFITGNRSESQGPLAGLDQISEKSEEGESKIENLTPSGDAEDFEQTSTVFEKSGNDYLGNMDEIEPIKEGDLPGHFSKVADGDAIENDGRTANFKKSERELPGKLKINMNINVGALLPGAALPKFRSANVSDEPDKSESTRPDPLIQIQHPINEISVQKKPLSPDEGIFADVSETEVLQSITKDRARIPVKRRPSSRKKRLDDVNKLLTDFPVFEEESRSQIPEVDDISNQQKDHKASNLKSSQTYEDTEAVSSSGISLVFGKTEKPKELLGERQYASLFNDEVRIGANSQEIEERTKFKHIFDDSFEDSEELFQSKLKSDYSKELFDDTVEEDFESHTNVDNTTTDSSDNKLFEKRKHHEGGDELFSTTSKTNSKPMANKPVLSKHDSSELFSDKSDSDDDLFSGKSKRSSEESKKGVLAKKASLFNDSGDSSEEDLFSSRSAASGIVSAGTAIKKVYVKTASVKKLENIEAGDFDPLTGFQ